MGSRQEVIREPAGLWMVLRPEVEKEKMETKRPGMVLSLFQITLGPHCCLSIPSWIVIIRASAVSKELDMVSTY